MAAGFEVGMRIVLDTNVIVSGIAYPDSIPGRILKELQQLHWQPVLSHYILDEVARVLPRLLRGRMADSELQELLESTLEILLFAADIVPLPDTGHTVDARLRDRNDQPVLQTLSTSQADYLVTGDKDLLVLAPDYPILSPAEFWQRYGHILN